MPQPECIIIVGAGQAGARVALGLRDKGWKGRVVLIGEEEHPPYERPALSKQALLDDDFAPPTIASPGLYEAQAIELRLRTRVDAIDLGTRHVRCSSADGRSDTLGFDQLVLATGGQARQLRIPGAQGAPIYTLRRRSDAQALAAQLQPGRHLVVVGGGFIGLEVAASARQRGCVVTLLESGARLLRRGVPDVLAAHVLDLHQRHGVDIRLQDGPAQMVRVADQWRMHCRSGQSMPADLVVAGIGMDPNVAIARDAGLTVRRGILVDACLRSIGAPCVMAVGDVCEFPDPARVGDHLVLESWHNAEAQAEVAVANLMGAASTYRPVPWMWSDQYDHTLQVVGECSGEAAARRALAQGDLLFWLKADGTVRGCAGLAPSTVLAKDFLVARRLVTNLTTCDVSSLARTDLPLKRLLSGG